MRVFNEPYFGLAFLSVLLALLAAYSLSVGAIAVSWQDAGVTLFGSAPSELVHRVVVDIRLPRILLGVLVGAALGVAGAALQGLFRNPLADPGLVGVSSGAALAAVATIVLGSSLLKDWIDFSGYFALPIAAFLGGLAVTLLIYRVATHNGRTDVGLMLLAGIAMNAIAGALTGILTYYASDEELRSLTFWSMGSIAGASFDDLSIALAPITLALVVLPKFARALNAFLMGESVSRHMGYNLKQLKTAVIVLSSLAVGAAVAVSGMIGFIGLVAPHLVRLLLGPDHRWLLPGSAIMGALLVVASDMLARTILSPAELPIGLVIAAFGGPFFLWLLLQRRNRVGW
ncbi:FecCD family ABC transporter permease [Thiomicrorhabdus heinhorstiae]|uniref:Iron ABC transporter permease n=1 Tax=Thiomicrorhabdus heinhorstiae TaxID=2748010 RepID=A0ABS0C1M0_9GAMM|nr:iron ABC transporter permease [Thiomicrorhabdus heinhorstiae]MBF6058126.1 iron ABC transporter permease [Thiomicrorhabdus heinhorstiae]